MDLKGTMKNEVEKMMEDVFHLYSDIDQKIGSLDRITQINRLYEELQGHLQGLSSDEVEQIENQIKSTLKRLLTFSENMKVVKALKKALDGHEDNGSPPKAPH